jgi:hypothetical protein
MMIRLSSFLIVAVGLLPMSASAAPGFQPRIGGVDTPSLSTMEPYFDGAFRADGTFEAFYGNGMEPAVAKVLPHIDGSAGEGAFEPYVDVDRFPGMTGTRHARIAIDDAGNAVVAWLGTCDDVNDRCVMASTRKAAGFTWSVPTRVDLHAATVSEYSNIEVAVANGMSFVAWESGDGTVTALVATLDLKTAESLWTAPAPIVDPAVETTADTGGAGRHLQAIAVDDSNAVWAVVLNYAMSATLVARFDPDAATWSTQRVDAAGVFGKTDPNLLADIAFGGGTGVVAWGIYGDPGISNVVAVTCEQHTGVCGAPTTISTGAAKASNPRVAVGDDGDVYVNWLEQAADNMNDLKSRHGETQDTGVAWGAVENVDGPGVPGGILAHSTAARTMHDVEVTADGAVIAAWLRENVDQTGRQLHGAVSTDGAWGSAQALAAPETASYGFMPPVRIRRDSFGDAVVLWAHHSTDGFIPGVVPFDATGPEVTLPADSTIGAGIDVSIGAQIRDTWSSVAEEDIVWTLDGDVLAATGRTITGCFETEGVHVIEVDATDGAGNVSNPTSFTLTVTGNAACTGGDTDHDDHDDHDGGGAGGDHGTDTSAGTKTDTGTGSGTGTGTGAGGDEKPKVNAFTTKSTVSRDKVPAVVGLKVSTARDRFDRSGIDVDFDIRMITRAKAPRGIAIGEVMAQRPKAGSKVTTGISDREPVRLDVYAGPVVKGAAVKANCTITRVNSAVKGLELDLAKLVLKSMKCPYQIDVQPVAKGDDAAVTGATSKKGVITIGVKVPRKPTNNDLLLTVRENPNGISFNAGDWTLTAGQKNAFTFQATTKVLVDGKIPLIQKAIVTIDMAGVGGARNLTGQTDALGEKVTVLEPPKAGFIDVLVEYPAANDVSLWGTMRLKVVDRSAAKVNSRLATVSGRVFQKHKTGAWIYQPGAKAPKDHARSARFIDFGAMVTWMQNAVAGLGGSIGSAFSSKGQSSEQVLSSALTKMKVSPSQMLIQDSLVSGNLRPIVLKPAQVVAAGGGNVVAAGGMNVVAPGGGNVVAPGGANVVSAGGGNVVAAGGANVISAGGANGIAASAPGLIAMGPAGVISAGGGNVVAAGGMNVIAAGGGNLLSDNGLGRRPGS